MKKAPKSHRINTKVTEADYKALMAIVKMYRFKSIYQLVQALIMCFLRHVDTVRDAEYDDGIDVEIDEMFDDLAAPLPKNKSFSTYQQHKDRYEG